MQMWGHATSDLAPAFVAQVSDLCVPGVHRFGRLLESADAARDHRQRVGPQIHPIGHGGAMSRFKVIEHKSSLQEIVNPVAVYARQLRDRAFAVDTETTGSTSDDEVIELGIVRAVDGSVVIDQQFRPSKRVEVGALKVHGISDAQLTNKPSITDLWMDYYPLLDGVTCVAWNASFDSRLFNQTIRKYSLDEPRIEWVCVMQLYKQFRQLPKVCKLEDACRALNVKTGNHRALNDALAAARVLYRMAESAPEDEVITRGSRDADDDSDEMTMTAREFLAQFGWREKKIAVVGGVEVSSQWIDPEGGKICDLSTAMNLQRARM
jgi:DNA polymerase III epsilon subunit family exonuclease